MTEATITISLEEYKQLIERTKKEPDYSKFNEAMAKFQEEYEPPKKDKKVDFVTKNGDSIKYDYADLESLQKAIRKVAGKHGLSWNVDFTTEKTEITNYGKAQEALMIMANVVINHSSGVKKVFRSVPLFASRLTDPQGLGGLKTYAERYALSSAFGIASGEDDEQMLNDKPDEPREPTRAELDAELNEAIEGYQSFLLEQGINMGAMNKWIIEKEGVNTIKQVEPLQVMGYLKSQVLKIKRQQAEAEAEAKKKEQQPEQGSLMEGNTTNTVNWG